ncbi:hypothetical protein JQS43_25750 [Natronosporangium hydrolyticum]|uniref:Uncharacterized protein n=1 Tax=Natronosporangium hydrolyticum TaxID=2811111 RepID=A0A895YHE1_9ACTN|nr:DUF6584 family protein [Natronosporangium hydrolyticum]QSB14803.1 hypothetical protein JQS43_25750 [Natronosporangium hydrolyticum]
MAKADVLARVKQDLALGHTYTATQRLRTLVAIQPEDLELRHLLTTVYRQTGNLVEAGRWAFLLDDVTDEERAAFERANPDPWLRLRLLRWDSPISALPDAGARERLTALTEEAAAAGPPSTYDGPLSSPSRSRTAAIPCLFVMIALGVVGILAAIGVFRMITWVIGG